MLSSPAYVNGVNGYTSPTNQNQANGNGNGVTTNGASSQAPNGVTSPKTLSNGVSNSSSSGKETSAPSTQAAVTAGAKA